MKKRPATETVEFSWNSTAPRDRKKFPLTRTRNNSKQSATDSPTLTVPTSWQGTLEEKILFLADRYVNHGDARLYWEIALELKQDRSKAAKDARDSLAIPKRSPGSNFSERSRRPPSFGSRGLQSLPAL